jgi:hypothetical protein
VVVIGGQQRADRADVGRVAGEYRVEARLGEGDDLQRAPALVEAQHVVLGDLVLEADATRALDAALFVKEN